MLPSRRHRLKQMAQLSQNQRLRYSRNIAVEEIGAAGQQRLLASTVVVLGCGALGNVAASYLAGAGVGHLRIADFDTIDISNLQRQIAYGESDAGKSKVMTLLRRLSDLNSEIEIDAIEEFVTPSTIDRLIEGADFVVDASDNPDTKYMIEEACCRHSIPYNISGVLAMRGQTMTHLPGTARYSDFFPESAGAGFTPCSIGGVLGPLPGIVASIQALEAIKYITGSGSLLTDTLLLIDGRDLSFNRITL